LPAARHIPSGESIRVYQKPTHPQPAKAGFACLAGAVSTPGAQKISEG
jgi:hypothetical protein